MIVSCQPCRHATTAGLTPRLGTVDFNDDPRWLTKHPGGSYGIPPPRPRPRPVVWLPLPVADSALTVVTPDPDVNGHITLGIVYEGTGGLRWTVISDALPSAATATTVPAMQAQANP